MRRKQLIEHVTNVITDFWSDDDHQDVVEAVLGDDAFDALAHSLNNIADGDADSITTVFERGATEVTDNELDFIAGDPDDPDAPAADSPAGFLASKIREVCG